MKRSATHARLPPRPSARAVPKRHRRYRNNVAAKFCPADAAGPRIPALLRQFASQCQVDCHRRWLQLLHTSCEKQGCLVRNCHTGVNFPQTHGAKSLIHSITMFLTYYVPTKVQLRSDHEWRQLLAALFTFHNYCARMRYIKDDHVLTTALYTLRNFRICTIPRRITELATVGYWTRMEQQLCDTSQPQSPVAQPPVHPDPSAPHDVVDDDDDACATDAFTTTHSAAPTSTASSKAVFAAISAAVYEEAHHVEAAHATQPVSHCAVVAQQPPVARAQDAHSFVRLATGAAHQRRKQLVCEHDGEIGRRRRDGHGERDAVAEGDTSPPQQRDAQHHTHVQPPSPAHMPTAQNQLPKIDNPNLQQTPQSGVSDEQPAVDEFATRPAEGNTEWGNSQPEEHDEHDANSYEAVLGGDMPLTVAQLMDDGWLLRSDDCDVDAEYTKAFLCLPPDVAKMGMRGMSLSCFQLALRNGIWRPIRRDDMYIANAYPPDEIFYY